ncbi:hypothetical protein BDW22DRAFT_1432327 [Trametopsis cervina]|nr:hypothetical protein BDW22DRAFT_1432327 [Trametopsis cervina]
MAPFPFPTFSPFSSSTTTTSPTTPTPTPTLNTPHTQPTVDTTLPQTLLILVVALAGTIVAGALLYVCSLVVRRYLRRVQTRAEKERERKGPRPLLLPQKFGFACVDVQGIMEGEKGEVALDLNLDAPYTWVDSPSAASSSLASFVSSNESEWASDRKTVIVEIIEPTRGPRIVVSFSSSSTSSEESEDDASSCSSEELWHDADEKPRVGTGRGKGLLVVPPMSWNAPRELVDAPDRARNLVHTKPNVKNTGTGKTVKKIGMGSKTAGAVSCVLAVLADLSNVARVRPTLPVHALPLPSSSSGKKNHTRTKGRENRCAM